MTLRWPKKLDFHHFHLPCSKLSLAKDDPEKDFIGAISGVNSVVPTTIVSGRGDAAQAPARWLDLGMNLTSIFLKRHPCWVALHLKSSQACWIWLDRID
jgi:hypothetical protein